ncbi:hypothetical protein DFH07DRAFT_1065719 [Mycena maculata]|uniref:BCAS3 WD40 domain-containing protein n=1 Tax=Mycena maculata TaxID=230809 RepID=A0AAD7HZ86_9AGAR|nr:hypothetical protein DFH07DRAFT_1065719 [Mycena maculata]
MPSPVPVPVPAPLTKRQRQALRRAGAASASPSTSPASAPSDAPSPASLPSPPHPQPAAAAPPDARSAAVRRARLQARETEEAGLQREKERARQHHLEEEERASPSKYPTPLPDEEDSDGGMGGTVTHAYHGVVGVMEDEFVGGLGGEEGEGGPLVDFDAPLVDLRDEPVLPIAEALLVEPSEAVSPPKRKERRVDRDATIRAASRPRAPVAGGGAGEAEGRRERERDGQPVQSHLRAPEVPRPPRALSALSHTRRAREAVTSAYSTASAAYTTAATVYSSFAPAPGRRASAAMHVSEQHAYLGGGGVGGPGPGGGSDEEEDAIVGARWDEVEVEVDGSTPPTRSPTRTTRRLLTLTYASGVQVWDASALGGVSEVLNLRIPPSSPAASAADNTDTDTEGAALHGPIVQAGVLPPLPREGGLELGILTPHALYVYALGRGRVVARFAVPAAAPTSAPETGYAYGGTAGGQEGTGRPCAFEAAGRVVVLATHSPPALIILARPSLQILHVIPAGALAVPPPPNLSNNVSPSSSYGNRASSSGTSPSTSPPHSDPHTPPSPPTPPGTPTFALHGRLLAFLTPPPAAPPPAADGTRAETWGRALGGTLGRFFSRSAPAASALLFNTVGTPGGPGAAALASISSALSASGGGAGAWVRVVDLRPLEHDDGGVADVHAFQAGRAAAGALAFSADGTRLVVVRRDGLGAGVWGVRPGAPGVAVEGGGAAAPAQLYELRRGRTGAVVEAVAGARDGRFVALATRRRTVHVFAVNPYGGRADARSHLGTRVRDGVGVGAGGVVGAEPVTEVHPLVRMRLPPPAPQNVAEPPPLAIAFVAPAAPPLRAPARGGGADGVQDVLVLDPADGVLSLRRVTVALEAPHAAGLPVSVSLPAGRMGMGMGASMSASPPAYAGAGAYARGHQAAGGGGGVEMAPGAELGGREVVVATWSLRRRRGWAEIRRAEPVEAVGESRPVKEDWLAQAELSTFSSAPRVLPRPIYLSHQFSFHALGEDYHALIRRYQFAIGGAKIDVRREVEVSAFAAGGAGGESFVEGYASSPRAIQRRSRAASSFDEPLASALAGAHYARPPPVLPMLPNGSPASFRSSIPVRAVAGLGDGVAEGLGRLRREMRHQRQRQRARSGGGDDVEASVPLAFDEEDEDFVVPPGAEAEADVVLRVHAEREDEDALSAATSRNGDSVASVSTPATSAHPLEEEERGLALGDAREGEGESGEWHGWAAEDTLAVEEAERFDDISVVGFLDEEQAAMRAEAERRSRVPPAARSRKTKRRN